MTSTTMALFIRIQTLPYSPKQLFSGKIPQSAGATRLATDAHQGFKGYALPSDLPPEIRVHGVDSLPLLLPGTQHFPQHDELAEMVGIMVSDKKRFPEDVLTGSMRNPCVEVRVRV